MYNWINSPRDFLFGNMFGILTVGALLLALLFFVAVYVYHAIAWSKIGEKQRYKNHWLAWIPFANISMILEMGGFHWAWVFLILIPFAGWLAIFVLFIISVWRVFEKRKYPGWFSLSLALPQVGWILYMVAVGFAAWGKGIKGESYIAPVNNPPRNRPMRNSPKRK
jgi:hypothetical protein